MNLITLQKWSTGIEDSKRECGLYNETFIFCFCLLDRSGVEQKQVLNRSMYRIFFSLDLFERIPVEFS